jgi:methylase of polypeptide subunit release factors
MKKTAEHRQRFTVVTKEKAGGMTYTPKRLSDFVAAQMVNVANNLSPGAAVRILDPAVGDGELLVSLLEQLTQFAQRNGLRLEVYGFETDQQALAHATARLKDLFPTILIDIKPTNFLDFVLEHHDRDFTGDLFRSLVPETYDLIIANPPYVRTQIMGASQAQLLAQQFGLSGRVDLYHAFILGIARVLNRGGIAGIIVSNRFMTTKSGSAVRHAIREQFNILHVWDLGDTKLFDAAVLPCVLLLEGRNGHATAAAAFTSIYESNDLPCADADDAIGALSEAGVVQTADGRRFRVQHGMLDSVGALDSVWRIATAASDAWLSRVQAHTWATFSAIGNIRVGVKTCADKVFIRSDWNTLPPDLRPELLRPVTTHKIAGRFKAILPDSPRQIIYPHEVIDGQRQPVDLSHYPKTKNYLEQHRDILEGRTYVREAGREWYEIWVPQDPNAWAAPKLVFRDIVEQPMFWIDTSGSIVNGDCYWLTCDLPGQTDLIWLAVAVGNSTFIERFYDYRFHNKLYAGRRRFITQYVEHFPLPDPGAALGKAIISKSKQAYACLETNASRDLEVELDRLVWQAFGFSVEEMSG